MPLFKAISSVKDKLTMSPNELLIKEATNNDDSLVSTSTLHAVAELTFQPMDYPKVMEGVWTCLRAPRQEWRRIQRAVLLSDVLMKFGSSRCVQEMRDFVDRFKPLQEFRYTDEDTERGGIIREKSRYLVEILSDFAKIEAERASAKKQKNKCVGMSRDDVYRGSYNKNTSYEEVRGYYSSTLEGRAGRREEESKSKSISGYQNEGVEHGARSDREYPSQPAYIRTEVNAGSSSGSALPSYSPTPPQPVYSSAPQPVYNPAPQLVFNQAPQPVYNQAPVFTPAPVQPVYNPAPPQQVFNPPPKQVNPTQPIYNPGPPSGPSYSQNPYNPAPAYPQNPSIYSQPNPPPSNYPQQVLNPAFYQPNPQPLYSGNPYNQMPNPQYNPYQASPSPPQPFNPYQNTFPANYQNNPNPSVSSSNNTQSKGGVKHNLPDFKAQEAPAKPAPKQVDLESLLMNLDDLQPNHKLK